MMYKHKQHGAASAVHRRRLPRPLVQRRLERRQLRADAPKRRERRAYLHEVRAPGDRNGSEESISIFETWHAILFEMRGGC